MEGDGFHDTMVMKSLEDMRRILARENTTMLPAVDKEAAAAGDTDKR
jgi:hypothetical protein